MQTITRIEEDTYIMKNDELLFYFLEIVLKI